MPLDPETLVKLDDVVDIRIHGLPLAEPEILASALRRITSFQGVLSGTIYVQPRESNGWIEYITRTNFKDGGGMTVGVLQRQPGGDIEWHS